MIRKVIFAIFLLVLGQPAFAGWQTTEWGMTPEQVVAALKGKAKLDSGEAGDRVQDGSSVGVVGTHSSGKWQFRSAFYFKNNKLSDVRLKLLNGQNGCGSLWGDMNSAYGEPFKDRPDTIMHYSIWHDAAKNNMVDLTEIGDLCTLSYQPLKSEDNAGL